MQAYKSTAIGIECSLSLHAINNDACNRKSNN